MKKFLTLVSLSILLFSCTKLEFPSKQTPPQPEALRASEDFVQGSEDIPLLVGMEKISRQLRLRLRFRQHHVFQLQNQN